MLHFPSEHQCDYRTDSRKTWLRRQRPDGSTYHVPIITGTPCSRSAVVSHKLGGKTVRRCTKHINSTY